MIEIKKQETITTNNTTKLIVKASGDVFIPPRVAPKQLKAQ